MRLTFSPLRLLLLSLVILTAGNNLCYGQRPPTPAINLSYLRIDFIQPGARPAGLGGAFIAAAQDETAAPINPAGLVYLKSAGASLHQRHVRTEFNEPQGSLAAPNRRAAFETISFDQTMAGIFVPLKRVTLAAFRNVAFDSRFNFETSQFVTTSAPLTQRQVLGGLGNFPGRQVDLDLEMVNDGVSAALKISRRLSVGITGKISVLNFRLIEQTFLDPEIATSGSIRGNTPETTYSLTTIDERNVQPSFSFGFMSNLIVDRLFVGGVVNLNPTFVLQTNVFLPALDIGSLELPSTDVADSNFRMGVPDTYGFGLYYLAHSRLRFSFDVQQIQYTDLLTGNDLNIPADDVVDPSGLFVDPDGAPDLTIDDATQVHFGLEYLLKVPELGLIPLRFGIHTEPGHRIYAHHNDADLRRLFPKQKDKIHYSFGLGVVFSSHVKFDGSADISDRGLELFGSTLVSIPF